MPRRTIRTPPASAARVGKEIPASGSSVGGVVVGVAMAAAQIQSASLLHAGLRQTPPTQLRPVAQLALVAQVPLQATGATVGVAVAVAQVQSTSLLQAELRQTPPEQKPV